ncbi:hypothetical protein Tco_0739082 [Tanacetum coccineum]
MQEIRQLSRQISGVLIGTTIGISDCRRPVDDVLAVVGGGGGWQRWVAAVAVVGGAVAAVVVVGDDGGGEEGMGVVVAWRVGGGAGCVVFSGGIEGGVGYVFGTN